MGLWRAAEPGWEDKGEGNRILPPLSYTWSGWGSRLRAKVCALNFVTVVVSGCQVPSGIMAVLAHLIPTMALWVAFLVSFYKEEPERLRHVPKMSPSVRCWDLSSNPAVRGQYWEVGTVLPTYTRFPPRFSSRGHN